MCDVWLDVRRLFGLVMCLHELYNYYRMLIHPLNDEEIHVIILLIKNISHDANDAYDQECVFKRVDHYSHTNNFRMIIPIPGKHTN